METLRAKRMLAAWHRLHIKNRYLDCQIQ